VLSVGFDKFVLTTAIATVPGAILYTMTGNMIAEMLEEIDPTESPSRIVRKIFLERIIHDWKAQFCTGMLLIMSAIFPFVMRNKYKKSGRESQEVKAD